MEKVSDCPEYKPVFENAITFCENYELLEPLTRVALEKGNDLNRLVRYKILGTTNGGRVVFREYIPVLKACLKELIDNDTSLSRLRQNVRSVDPQLDKTVYALYKLMENDLPVKEVTI